MEIFRGYAARPGGRRAPRAVAAIGNFDGVHRGHRAVLDAAQKLAARCGAARAVVTFHPHPRAYFAPDAPAFHLTPLRGKARALAAAGVARLYLLRFDAAMARLTPEAFVTRVLDQGLGLAGVAIGADFRFGAQRAGDADAMRRLTAARGIACAVVDPVGQRAGQDGAAEIFSSSAIRAALRAGDTVAATHMLGRPHEVEGRVRHGEKLGRTLGFPTANLDLRGLMAPRYGVYAVQAMVADDGRWRDGVASLGVRPTVAGAGAEPLLETFVFDAPPNWDLYGRRLRVRLIAFLRDEARFDDLDALIAQMRVDADAARAVLANRDEPRRRRAPQGG